MLAYGTAVSLTRPLVYSNVHYHRYMGRGVAAGTMLASTLAMLLLASTFPYQLPSSLQCPQVREEWEHQNDIKPHLNWIKLN